MEAKSNKFVLYGLNKHGQTIDTILGELDIPKDSQAGFELRLILVEALNNAFYHGNQGSAEKSITIRYDYFGSRIRLEVEDTGKGFDNAVIPLEIADENLLDSSGRGLFLINSMADLVQIRNNTIVIEKQVFSEYF